jgi:hypothetical protein
MWLGVWGRGRERGGGGGRPAAENKSFSFPPFSHHFLLLLLLLLLLLSLQKLEQTGKKKTDLVPVYHLGTAQLLTFSGPGKLSRRARASLGLLWGTAGLPLPRRSDIISLVGEPIPVERDEDPSQELIDETHRRFCEALVRLFDQHKHLLGKEWEYKELQIV